MPVPASRVGYLHQTAMDELAAHARAVRAALEAASAPLPLDAAAVVADAKVTVRTDVARGEAAALKAVAFAEAALLAADTPQPDVTVSVSTVEVGAKVALSGVKAAERRVRQRK